MAVAVRMACWICTLVIAATLAASVPAPALVGAPDVSRQGDGGADSRGRTAPAVVARVGIVPERAVVEPEGRLQFSALVLDAQGAPIPRKAVRWTVSDPPLGEVQADGTFIAFGRPGRGSITVTSDGVVGSARLFVGSYALAGSATVGDLFLRVAHTPAADVLLDVGIPASDASGVPEAVDAALETVEAGLSVGPLGRPAVYILAGERAYGTALRVVAGIANSAEVARRTGGVYHSPPPTVILPYGARQARATLHHELTHFAVDVLAGGRPLPRWFNEGLARLMETDGDSCRRLLVREHVAEVAASGRLYSWRQLVEFSGNAGIPYDQAALVVAELRSRAGMRSIVALLRRVGEGETFESAFERAAGEPLDSFGNETVGRLAHLLPTGQVGPCISRVTWAAA